MLRHIVLVTYKSDASEETRAAHRAAVRRFADIPEVRSLACGVNVGSGPNHHDFAMVADFDDLAAFRRYLEGPAHKAYVGSHAGCVDRLAAIQHDI